MQARKALMRFWWVQSTAVASAASRAIGRAVSRRGRWLNGAPLSRTHRLKRERAVIGVTARPLSRERFGMRFGPLVGCGGLLAGRYENGSVGVPQCR